MLEKKSIGYGFLIYSIEAQLVQAQSHWQRLAGLAACPLHSIVLISIVISFGGALDWLGNYGGACTHGLEHGLAEEASFLI